MVYTEALTLYLYQALSSAVLFLESRKSVPKGIRSGNSEPAVSAELQFIREKNACVKRAERTIAQQILGGIYEEKRKRYLTIILIFRLTY